MQTTSSRTKMKTINGDSLTPILIFRRLQGTHKFLLESSAQHEGAGRFSFIGANPRKTYKGVGDEIQEFSYKTGQTYTHKGDLFTLLKRLMPRISNTTEFPFSGGAIGYIGKHATNSIASNEEMLTFPDVHFHVYETIVVFDHVTDEVTLIYTNIDAETKEPNLEELAQQLLTGKEGEETTWFYQALKTVSNQQREEFITNLTNTLNDERCHVVLSQQYLATIKGDAFALYRQLRKKNPAPYMYYVTFDDHIVLGTSPESLIQVKGQRVIASPTEGFYPRGGTTVEDLEHESKLYDNAEVRKSHTVLVTAVQQELATVCYRDSIEVIDAMRIERLKQALHMTSQVEGQLLPMLHAVDVLAATLPPVSSIPAQLKERHLEKIDQNLPAVFGGAIGFIGFNGHLDFALTGKSIVIEQEAMHMQSTVIVTKYSNVQNVVKQINTEQQLFLHHLENGGGVE
ncbi:chorismate-binding protein [Lysinibacillus sp. NPDC097195]|uniref:chorismate-binding protein n=1 Tax=Lysinibacillus sp. NPDC097195 TaxID=3364141 RepID=UPI0038098337